MEHIINTPSYPSAFFPRADTIFVRAPRKIAGVGGSESRMADIFYLNSSSDKKQTLFIDTPTLTLSGVYKAPEQTNGPSRFSIRLSKDDSDWLSMILINLSNVAFNNMVDVLNNNKDLCPRACRSIIDDPMPTPEIHLKPIFSTDFQSHFLKVHSNCPVWDYDDMETGGKPLSSLTTLPSRGQYRLRLRIFGLFLGPHRQGATHSSSLSLKVEQILFRSTLSDETPTLGLNIVDFKNDIDATSSSPPTPSPPNVSSLTKIGIPDKIAPIKVATVSSSIRKRKLDLQFSSSNDDDAGEDEMQRSAPGKKRTANVKPSRRGHPYL